MLDPLSTGISNPRQNKPCIVMDRNGHAHATWLEGSTLKYFRHNGISWEYLGDSSIVMKSDGMSLPVNCMAISKTGIPHLLWMDADMLLHHVYWNGAKWTTYGDGVVGSRAVQGASITMLRSVLYVSCIEKVYSDRHLRIYSLDSGAWTVLNSMQISSQDNDSTDMVSKSFDESVYSLWKVLSGSEEWISYSIYNIIGDSWVSLLDNKISVTDTDGEITGFDFTSIRDFWSSSSSSNNSSSSSHSSNSSS
jgi:hypothetical protein